MSSPSPMPVDRCARDDWRVRALIGVWIVAVAGGWCCITRDALSINEPASHGAVDFWPADSALPRSESRPTLLVFLHPKCPCSRASLKELERTLTSIAGTHTTVPQILVVATVPPAAAKTWWETDTMAQARQLTRARVCIDRDGREAARFGASTSGQIMLFDAAGTRRYSGGITVARGHEGASTGADRLTGLLRGESNVASEMPVFGCRLCLPQPDADDEIADHNTRETERTDSSI